MKQIVLVLLGLAMPLAAQTWKPSVSASRAPHFETVNGKPVFFADGLPFTVLAVETQWEGLIYGRYGETMQVYDYMYPAAAKMHLNALKVPIKWSIVEPSEGVYDFSYVDHVRHMAEANNLKLVLGWFGHYASGGGTIYSDMAGNVFAPMYIIRDPARFPRAVDADGKPHDDAVSYDYPAILEREIVAFQAFMRHLRETDAHHTVLMIQVENEIAVFGADRGNRNLWRDHSAASNRRFEQRGFSNDLKYSAWDLTTNWLRPLTDAGAGEYPIPFFCNFVGGTLAERMVGGAPGEDVATYMDNIPALSFIGLNHYPTWGDDQPAAVNIPASLTRAELQRYKIGRNIPSLTETNSDNGPLAPRNVFISVGEFGSALFAPWALGDSCPTEGEPYVQKDGTLANGAFALREAYTAIEKGRPVVAQFGGTDRTRVFLAEMPGYRFKDTKDVAGIPVTVSGVNNGQAIAIRPAENEMLIVGFRCHVLIKSPARDGPIKIESGAWIGGRWEKEGVVVASAVNGDIRLSLTEPQAARISW